MTKTNRILLFLACLSGLALAWPACAPGGVVASCPCNLTDENLTYVLNSDLTSSGTCIGLYYPNLNNTLDCQGHSITGSAIGIGVYVFDAHYTHITNCHVSNFTYGFAVTAAEVWIYNNTVEDSTTGVFMNSDADCLLSNNTILGCGTGVYSASSSSLNIRNNLVCGSYFEDFRCAGNNFVAGSNSIFDTNVTCTAITQTSTCPVPTPTITPYDGQGFIQPAPRLTTSPASCDPVLIVMGFMFLIVLACLVNGALSAGGKGVR